VANIVCGASRDLPLDKSSAWDGSAAKASVFEWAGWPDHPDIGKAAKAFLCYDSSEGKLKGSYHLPFAKVVDGTLTAVAAGIRAAASRLPQTDGLSDSVKASARAVIDAYEKKMGASDGKDGEKDRDLDGKGDGKGDGGGNPMGDGCEPPERSGIPAKPKPRPLEDSVAAENDHQGDNDEDLEGATGSASRGYPAIYAHRAPLMRAASLSPPDPEKVAYDPDIFAENPPYTFRAVISTDQTDAYHTRMHPSSLRNYAADAEEGRALQNSHRADELPMGHSYRGRYAAPSTQPDQIAKTTADFYVVPGMKLNEVHSDDFIRGIRSGTIRDVSVGFYGGKYRCTLCDRGLLDVDERGELICGHTPGLTYRVAMPDGGEMEDQAAAWVHDARLAEVSAVYDGATPGATIIKAKQMAESGRLNPMQARWLELQYRGLKLYGAGRYFALDPKPGRYFPPGSPEKRMHDPLPVVHDPRQGLPVITDPAHGPPPAGEQPSTLEAILAAAGLATASDPLDVVRALITDYSHLRTSAGSHPPPPTDPPPPSEERAPPVMERDLADARAYRVKVTKDAAYELVRALGNAVDVEFHTRRWNDLPVADVTRERDHYAQLAERLFPGGRRGLADQERTPPDPNQPRTVPPVPDSVYASGAGFAPHGRKD
jgi:hypothetical protein